MAQTEDEPFLGVIPGADKGWAHQGVAQLGQDTDAPKETGLPLPGMSGRALGCPVRNNLGNHREQSH